jgi:hypothetical protein
MQHANWITAGGALLAVVGTFLAGTSADEKNAQIARLSSELYEYARGGDSFVYLHIQDLGTPDQRAAIMHCGKVPVRNASFEVRPLRVVRDPAMTYREKVNHFLIVREPVIAPQDEIALTSFPFQADSEEYVILTRAENAVHEQVMMLVNVQGAWFQAYVVVEYGRADGMRVLRKEYSDAALSPVLLQRLKRDARVPEDAKQDASCAS